MADNAVQNDKPDQSKAKAAAVVPDSVPALWAGWFGVALTFLALLGFLVVASNLGGNSLGFAALTGVAILSVTLTALIILARAVGIVDSTAALGLPSGSIRALLAIGLAVVFVAVASWTLGGLFDPTGRQVAQLTLPSSEVDGLQKRYPASDYILFETQRPPTDNAASLSDVKVYFKRGVDQNLIDMAKQILTISATVLVTIIGFYFGSNSTADAARSVSDALKQAGTDSLSGTPTITNPQEAASTIASIAAGTKVKLNAYGDDPMALLRKAIAGSTDPELTSALATAQDQLTILNAKASAIATDADRAKEAVSAPTSSDPVVAKQLKDRLGVLMADATAASRDFEQAYAKFQSARDIILRKTAKG